MMSMDKRIELGQCFNLAHAEALAMMVTSIDTFVERRTMELFRAKQRINKEADDNGNSSTN